jgi:hypothetical protein
MFFKEISEESPTSVSETVGRCHVVKESPVYVSSERGNKQDRLHQPHVPYFLLIDFQLNKLESVFKIVQAVRQ